MKKSILTGLLILFLGGICNTTSFAAQTQTITMKSEVVESLTNFVAVSSDYATTISWGDNNTDTILAGEDVEISHTYATTGSYEIKITGTDIYGLRITYAGLTEIDVSSVSTLEKLNIAGNKITNLNLSNNLQLKELNCRNNYLTTLNIEQLENLQILNAGYNQLSTLKLTKNIKELYIPGNRLNVLNSSVVFDVSKYSLLKILNCENNNIEQIILNGNKLEELYCNNNLINDVDLSSNTGLKIINCSNNNIRSLNLSQNVNLVKLSCDNNNISQLNVSALTNLKEVSCFGNNLELTVSNLEWLLIENTSTIIGNATTIVKINIIGNGSIVVNNNNLLLYPNKNCYIENVKLNGVEINGNKDYIDIKEYNGENILEIIFTSDEEMISISNMNKPQLLDKMIPLKYNGKNWVITTQEDTEWYNYSKSNAKWANVMLRDNAKYLDYDGVTLIDIGENVSYESLIGREVPAEHTGSMYVWIPRYTYKIDGDDILIRYSNDIWDDTTGEYLVHPAFNYAKYLGGDASNIIKYSNGLNEQAKLRGIWVAKYQASDSIANPKYYSAGEELLNSSIGDAFTAAKINQVSNGSSHMIKNTEWGAVAYLATAIGALNTESTTGNIYGVYNMNSGAEYVAHYIELIGGISNYSVRKNGSSMIPYPMIKYNHTGTALADEKDIDVLRIANTEDNDGNNIQELKDVKGIGINEVGTGITGVSITQNMPTGENAFFIRGIDGIYSYSASNGAMYGNTGFRNVMLPNSYSEDVSREYFTIIAQSTGSGVISPFGKTTVLKGDSITYAIRPETGFEILDVKVDNVSVYDKLQNCGSYYTYTFSNVNKNHEIYAEFASSVEAFDIILINNPDIGGYVTDNFGNVVVSKKYNSRSTVTLIANPNYGYKFESWEILEGDINNQFTDIQLKEKAINFEMPGNNVTLKANYVVASEALLTVINGDTTTKGYEDVGKQVTITAALKGNFIFTGWESKGLDGLSPEELANPVLQFVMPPTDVTLRATYRKEGYLISYDANAGEDIVGNMPLAQIKTHGVNLILSDNIPIRSGYDFVSWNTRSDGTGKVYVSGGIYTEDKDLQLYAIWSQQIKLSYLTINGVLDGEEYDDLGEFARVDVYVNGNLVASQVKDYWQQHPAGTSYEITNIQSSEGYIFNGVTNGSLVGAIKDSEYTNIELSFSTKTYTISYDSNAGEDVVSNMPIAQTKTHGIELTLSDNTPIRSGYIFTGWNTDREGNGTDYIVSGSFIENSDRTLYAQWEVSIDKVMLIVESLNSSARGEEKVGERVQVSAIVAEGYRFTEWHAEGITLEPEEIISPTITITIPANDVKLTANYIVDNTVKTYTISYDANAGEDIVENMPSSQEKTYGENVILSSNVPTRIGYLFNGWNTASDGNGRSYNADGTYSEDANVTLYAMWGINSYNVIGTVNPVAGGSIDGVGSKTPGDTVTLTSSVNTGYNFTGWEVVSGEVTLTIEGNTATFTMPANNVEIRANYELKKYTVSYDANSGTGVPASQEKTHGVDLTLSNTIPTRTNYNFVGWNTLSNGNGTEYEAGEAYNVDADVTLYAIWELKKYTVTYNANGGSNAPDAQEKTHGVNLTLSNSTPTRSGYEFVKWNTQSNGNGTNYNPSGTYSRNEDVTLYAQWQKVTVVTVNKKYSFSFSSSNTTIQSQESLVDTRDYSNISKVVIKFSGAGSKGSVETRVRSGGTWYASGVLWKAGNSSSGTLTLNTSSATGSCGLYVDCKTDSGTAGLTIDTLTFYY